MVRGVAEAARIGSRPERSAAADMSVPVERVMGRRSSVSGQLLEGRRVASNGLGPLPRRKGSALALGCSRSGRVVLPLVRAAAVSTG